MHVVTTNAKEDVMPVDRDAFILIDLFRTISNNSPMHVVLACTLSRAACPSIASCNYTEVTCSLTTEQSDMNDSP